MESRGGAAKPPRAPRLSLPYAAQDLAQHPASDPSPAVSVVMVAVVMMAAVASPLDEPQHLLRATEESPDLADVHVRLAFFSTILREQSYGAPREKFRPGRSSFAALASGLG
jgi:hypothetical protein